MRWSCTYGISLSLTFVQKFLYDNTIKFRKKWFKRANSDQLWNFFGKPIVEDMAADLLYKKNKSDKTNRENASKKKAESATVMEVDSDEDESDDDTKEDNDNGTDDTQEKEESESSEESDDESDEEDESEVNDSDSSADKKNSSDEDDDDDDDDEQEDEPHDSDDEDEETESEDDKSKHKKKKVVKASRGRKKNTKEHQSKKSRTKPAMSIFAEQVVDFTMVHDNTQGAKTRGKNSKAKSEVEKTPVHSILVHANSKIASEAYNRANTYADALKRSGESPSNDAPLKQHTGLTYVTNAKRGDTNHLITVGRAASDLPTHGNYLYVDRSEVQDRNLESKQGLAAWKSTLQTVLNFKPRYVHHVEVTMQVTLPPKDEVVHTPKKRKSEKKDTGKKKKKSKKNSRRRIFD